MSGLATVTLRWEVIRTFQVAVDNVEQARAAAVGEWRNAVSPYGNPHYNGYTPAMVDTEEGDPLPTWEPSGVDHIAWDPITEVTA